MITTTDTFVSMITVAAFNPSPLPPRVQALQAFMESCQDGRLVDAYEGEACFLGAIRRLGACMNAHGLGAVGDVLHELDGTHMSDALQRARRRAHHLIKALHRDA